MTSGKWYQSEQDKRDDEADLFGAPDRIDPDVDYSQPRPSVERVEELELTAEQAAWKAAHPWQWKAQEKFGSCQALIARQPYLHGDGSEAHYQWACGASIQELKALADREGFEPRQD